jgi:hypothetical protein
VASHPHLFHHLGSGRAAILANGFEREAVFDALRERRCYALTGPQILVDFNAGEHSMGSEIPLSDLGGRARFDVGISTSVPIATVEVFRNGERCDLVRSGRREERFQWVDPVPADAPVSSYFVKVTRVDQEMAWTSPIWIVR